MKIFGFEITRTKAGPAGGFSSVDSNRGWWSVFSEPFGGAWQNVVVRDSPESVLAFSAVFSCVSRIAKDIAKLDLRVVLEDEESGICVPIAYNSPFAATLRRPNHYQNRIAFVQSWAINLLLHGNAYALKERDGRGMVRALYLLDPARVTPLITRDGEVYYKIAADHLAGLVDGVTVPASEVIHDRGATLWHPLVGVSPIYACAMTATQGNKIQANSAAFFENMSRPSGMLTAPGEIKEEFANRMKKQFEENFAGKNIGRIAVAGNGLEYKPMMISAVDAELVKQLEWTVADVARCFSVPLYKLGGPAPSGVSIESLNQAYYDECLQSPIESMELSLTEGLEMPTGYEAEFDLDGLRRMDLTAQSKAEGELVKGGIKSPDEARRRFNLPPVPGGRYPYLQQQNYSLEALAKRDAQPDPFKTNAPPAAAPATPPPEAANDPSAEAEAQAREILAAFTKGLAHA